MRDTPIFLYDMAPLLEAIAANCLKWQVQDIVNVVEQYDQGLVCPLCHGRAMMVPDQDWPLALRDDEDTIRFIHIHMQDCPIASLKEMLDQWDIYHPSIACCSDEEGEEGEELIPAEGW